MMQPKNSDRQRRLLCPNLLDQLGPRNRFPWLAKVAQWQMFEGNFWPLHAAPSRTGKPVCLMVSRPLLKQLENLSDECAFEAWDQNTYSQTFCGHQQYTWTLPCNPSELTDYRRHIGDDGVHKIFEVSVALHGGKAKEAQVIVDSTVQEKNITFPTDAKHLTKTVTRCHTIAILGDAKIRHSYPRETKSLLRTIRLKSKGRRQAESQRVVRCLRTIDGILIHELKRKLSPQALNIHQQALDLYDRLKLQQRSDTDKIFSFHEPGVSCICKYKAHKKYEFGAKASVTATKTGVIIVGTLSFQDNPFDGHTRPAVLSQVESLTGQRSAMAICDRGCRGKRKVGVNSIVIPGSDRRAKTASNNWQARERLRHRATIEPIIGHLKNDHRTQRNYLKGQIGDSVNLSIAGASFNFWKLIRILVFLCVKFLGHILRPIIQPYRQMPNVRFKNFQKLLHN